MLAPLTEYEHMQVVAVGVLLITTTLFLDLDDRQKLLDVDNWKSHQCSGTSVTGKYANYAEGFSIRLPRGLIGKRGQAAGPERGVSIPLSPDCEGVVEVFGEANSLDWPKPEDAIASEITRATEDSHRVGVTRYASRLGSLLAAGVTLRSDRTDDVEDIVVAFRPGGGPVYFARLRSTAARYVRDRDAFTRIIRSFRLEPWR